MSQPTNVQPMTRRERRLFEQRASQAVPTVNTDYLTSGAPSFTPAPVAPVVVAPPAPRALTRRERRALENESPASVATQYTGASITPATPTNVVANELWPLVEASSTARSPTISEEPLPPVFGVQSPTQVADFSASRTVGAVSPATSSLILPHTPTIDIAGPLGSTGEIVVTGQMRLPSSLAERGGAPALVEDRDQDEVMDAYVTGDIALSAKPMRASQAISTKGDDTDIVLVRRARFGTATVVTGLSAAVLGLAAMGLLVLAMLTDVVG
jgi:hypothetical protein